MNNDKNKFKTNKMKNSKFESIVIASYLPVFNGFYSTYFEYQNEEQDIENYNEDNKTDLNYEDFEWDYKDYHKRVAEKCVEEIENELKDLDIKVEFTDLISPKEYNFTNDSINVNYYLTKDSFNKLIQYLKDNKTEFAIYLEDRYKSRSGFISFMDYDVDSWLNEYLQNDEKLQYCFGSILEFYFLNEGFLDSDLVDAVSSEMYIDFKVK